MCLLVSVQSGLWSRSRSRFFRCDGVRGEIFFATPTLILIILYVNCLKMKTNKLHQIAYILSYGVRVILILNPQLSKH